VNKGLGDLLMGRFQDTAEGLTGNAHLLGRLVLVQPLHIGQAYRLDLVKIQRYLLEHPHGDALGFIKAALGNMANPPTLFRSGHNSHFQFIMSGGTV
jgi:hypothetical protein